MVLYEGGHIQKWFYMRVVLHKDVHIQKWSYIRVVLYEGSQSWCNPWWLTGLKTPTN